jgi:hypothetical protein
MGRMCVCGHPGDRHEHGFGHTRSYCGQCWCPKYKRLRWWRKYVGPILPMTVS